MQKQVMLQDYFKGIEVGLTHSANYREELFYHLRQMLIEEDI